MTPTSILTLDLATNFGWARCVVGGQPEYGAVGLPSTGRDIGRFLAVYERWLVKRCREYEIDLVAYEQPIIPKEKNLHTLRKLYSLAGVTELVCKRENIRVVEVPISTWRVHFIGKCRGFATKTEAKEMAIDACLERGWNPATHDEAEALGIMDYVFAKMELEKPWPDGGLFAKDAT